MDAGPLRSRSVKGAALSTLSDCRLMEEDAQALNNEMGFPAKGVFCGVNKLRRTNKPGSFRVLALCKLNPQ
jgi:hypothetical protein